MVDDEIDRYQRVDLLGIAAERLHGVAHRGQIDHRRHAGEILHQHPRRAERDFMFERALLQPLRHRDDVVLLDGAIVFIAQQVFQQHLHRIRQPGNSLQTVFLGGGQAVIDIGLAANLEGLLAFEAVERGHVRQSQFYRFTRQGYRNTADRAWPSGLQSPIVCCIKFRLIESFQWHRHSDYRAAALRYPKIPMRYR